MTTTVAVAAAAVPRRRSSRPTRAAVAVAAFRVSMQNIQFDPKDITVKPGETITFTNDESIPHDVHKQSGPGGDFASGPDGGMNQGDTFELKLDKPGKYDVRLPRARARDGRHDHRQVGRRLTPKPRRRSSAVSPSPPREGSRPSWVAAS